MHSLLFWSMDMDDLAFLERQNLQLAVLFYFFTANIFSYVLLSSLIHFDFFILALVHFSPSALEWSILVSGL